MFNLAIKRSQLVEAQFIGTPSAGRRYNFTEVPNISRNNLLLYGFEAYSADQVSTAMSGNTVVAAADTDQMFVTFVNIENDEFIYQMPVYNTIRNNVGGFVTVLQPQIINLTDCYVTLSDATGISSDEVLLFNLYYDIVG